MIDKIPNHPFKLPFFGVCAAIGVGLAIANDARVLMAIVAVVSIVCVGVILSGNNPAWMQSRLDRRYARRRGSQT